MKLNEIVEQPATTLWVDDVRMPSPSLEVQPDVARTYNDAIKKLSSYNYEELYLDHDLGDFSGPNGREMTGYDVVMWLVQRKHDGGYVPHSYQFLTSNPVGRKNMSELIARYLS